MSEIAAYLYAAAQAALAGHGSFVHESPELATLTANAAALPLIVLGDFTTVQARASASVETAQLTLYFADRRPGQGDDPAAHQAAVDRMRALARRFLAALDAQPLAQLDGLRQTPFASAYEAELDGVGVQLQLTVPAAPLLAACLPPATPPTPADALVSETGVPLDTEAGAVLLVPTT